MRKSLTRLKWQTICGLMIVCLLFSYCSCIFAQTVYNMSQHSQSTQGVPGGVGYNSNSLLGQDYLIGPGDVLDIKIFDSEDLNRTVRVGGDGYISLPLIGSIIAGGLNVSELEFNMAYEYSKKYLQNPQISVYVQEFHSKRVAVLGEVKNPQLLEMTRNSSNLLEMISLCGGVTKDAGDLIYIIRHTEQYDASGRSDDTHAVHYSNTDDRSYGRVTEDVHGSNGSWDEEDYLQARDEVITVNISELVKYQNPLSNVDILPGDMISVPPASFYFVFGEVDKPGAFQLKTNMTALQALSQAGSFSSVAKNKIKLIREDLENREKIITTLDVRRLAKGEDEDVRIIGGDVLLVGKSSFKEVRNQLLAFSNSAVTAFTTAYAYDSFRD
ncbi:periplasmic protein [Candidatus Scalindua japonica]|uniref:Periplasmic protein n=1 Tax=Candidatus Scalindua japonica TaxID=1284222 RepID=A0A286U414_9BACT|nr:polysaccharide biosynthesis/export family protein [Candidatus Scalindua japonica]GAX62900.1 periplasmic protein [Candidatus Scalindua japonica]